MAGPELPRGVRQEAEKFRMKPGDVMDVTEGWDFRKKEDRDKARKRLQEQKPALLIGRPRYWAFSPLQRVSRWTPKTVPLGRERRAPQVRRGALQGPGSSREDIPAREPHRLDLVECTSGGTTAGPRGNVHCSRRPVYVRSGS